VLHRAIDDSPLTPAFVDSLFGRTGHPGEPTATVLVARDGRVLVDRSYGIPVHPRYTPTTTAPNFPLGEIGGSIQALAAQIGIDGSGASHAQLMARRLFVPLGITRTTVSGAGEIESNVDELYRLELGMEWAPTFTRDSTGAPNDALKIDVTRGWRSDSVGGRLRVASYATADGRRGAFVRFPDQRASIIILTSSDEIDARRISEQIAERLFGAR
jgi:CubicO group peptidase (beta-lactamase class C family)